MAGSPAVLLEELARSRSILLQKTADPDKVASEKQAEDDVEGFLDFTPRTADTIYGEMKKRGLSLTLPQFLQRLLELQMEGRIRQEGGYFFLSGEKF